jgi:hypothetical protein
MSSSSTPSSPSRSTIATEARATFASSMSAGR